MKNRRSLMLASAKIASASLALLALSASSATVQFDIEAENAFGPLTEVGHTTINVSLDSSIVGGAHFRCGATGAFVFGRLVQISAVLDPGDPAGPIPPDCELAASADLGPLDPGDYTVTANIILPDRSGANAASMFTIVARGNKCNVDPLYNQ